jgi:hypothetical protein
MKNRAWGPVAQRSPFYIPRRPAGFWSSCVNVEPFAAEKSASEYLQLTNGSFSVNKET